MDQASITRNDSGSDVPGTAIAARMADLGRKARAAAAPLRLAGADARTRALIAIARHLREGTAAILSANAADVALAQAAGADAAFVDRLALTPARVEAMAAGVETVAALPDPVGAVMAAWDRPNGLRIERVRTPLGVIGVIFEARPNVCADAAALCLRAGNPVILRGGSDSLSSCRAIGAAVQAGLAEAGLPADAVAIVPDADREAVGVMLAGLDGALDVIVPRGGKSLVARVQAEARIPVFAHLEGLCHTFLHAAADPARAVAVTLNAKMRRVSVCGATETLLVDAAAAPVLLPAVAQALQAAGCTLRGDDRARAIWAMEPATEADWRTEYLAPVLAVAVVDGLEGAIAHIARHGSGHTDAIVTEDTAAAERFLDEVDSAIVLHNASTQFADGGEFGFGAEIGIATGRMHARGPVGAEQLTTFKYRVRGTGQVRP